MSDWKTAGARLAYRLALFGRSDVAEEVVERCPDPSGAGSSGSTLDAGAYCARFNVVDTVLAPSLSSRPGMTGWQGLDSFNLN